MSEEQKQEILKGDFLRENDDEYTTNLITNKKKDLYVKVGMGAFYIMLLVVSLLVV